MKREVIGLRLRFGEMHDDFASTEVEGGHMFRRIRRFLLPSGMSTLLKVAEVALCSVFVVMLTLSGYAAEPEKPAPEAVKKWDAGFKLYRNHQYAEAIRCFEASLSVDPLYFRALNGKGICLAFMGRPREGLGFIERALAVNPGYENGYFNRGLALELSGRWTEAITSYDQALKIAPTNAWSWYGKACSYGMLGNAGKAAEALQHAIELNPSTRQSALTEEDLSRVRKDPRVARLLTSGQK